MNARPMALVCLMALAGLVTTPLFAATPSEGDGKYVVVIKGVT